MSDFEGLMDGEEMMETLQVVKPKERPILFNGEMVRAILDGRKTNTRRIVNVANMKPSTWTHAGIDGFECLGNDIWSAKAKGFNCYSQPFSSPFGNVGDRLWVRETFRVWTGGPEFLMDGERNEREVFEHRLSKFDELYLKSLPIEFAADDSCDDESPWRPSIHMPRWASRITLVITDVRVERLNDISEEDAIAEGVKTTAPIRCMPSGEYGGEFPCARINFESLWKSINGPDSWSANPWVWVVEFKRIEA